MCIFLTVVWKISNSWSCTNPIHGQPDWCNELLLFKINNPLLELKFDLLYMHEKATAGINHWWTPQIRYLISTSITVFFFFSKWTLSIFSKSCFWRTRSVVRFPLRWRGGVFVAKLKMLLTSRRPSGVLPKTGSGKLATPSKTMTHCVCSYCISAWFPFPHSVHSSSEGGECVAVVLFQISSVSVFPCWEHS